MNASELLVRMDELGVIAAGWIATWWLHSVALCALALLAGGALRRGAFREQAYKVALLGALATSSAQLLGFGFGDALRVELAARDERGLVAREPAVDDGRGELLATEGATALGGGALASPTSTPDSSASAPLAPGACWRPAHVLPLAALLAAAVGGALLLRDRRRVTRALAGRREVGDAAWRRDLVTLARRAGLRRAPRLCASARLASPVALARGELVVPARALVELDAEARRALLAHELAHLARRDPLWLGATTALVRLLPLNPLQTIVRRRLIDEQELACDAEAVRWLGAGLPLARCLERVAGWMAPGAAALPMASMAARGSALVRRVERALAPVEAPATRARSRAFALALAGGLALLACAGPKVEPADEPHEAEGEASGTDEARKIHASVEERPERDGNVVAVLEVRPDGSVWAEQLVLREPGESVDRELFDGAVSGKSEEGRPIVNIQTDGRMVAKDVRLYDPRTDSFELVDAYLEQLVSRMERRPLDPERPEATKLAMGELVLAGEGPVSFRTVQKLMERAGRVGIWQLRLAYEEPQRSRSYDVPLPTDVHGFEGPVEEGELDVSVEPIDPAFARPKVELTLRVLEPGRQLDPVTGEAWNGMGRFVYDDSRRIEYSVHGLRTESLAALRERLAELRTEYPDSAATIDARRGIVYRDVVDVLDTVMEAGFDELTFVGAYD